MIKEKLSMIVAKATGQDFTPQEEVIAEKLVNANLFDAKEFKKSWEEMNNNEREISVLNAYGALLGKMMKEVYARNEKPFWSKKATKEEIDNSLPYNASNGFVYENTTAIILKAAAQLHGYEKPQFLSMREGNILGGKLKTASNEKGEIIYPKGVKVPYFAQGEWVEMKDKDGNVITVPAKDKDGNVKVNEKGEVIMKPRKEFKEYDQKMIETTTLYHVSQFEGLDHSKLKERDLSKLEKKREYFKDNPKALEKSEFIDKLSTINRNQVQKMHDYIKAKKKDKISIQR